MFPKKCKKLEKYDEIVYELNNIQGFYDVWNKIIVSIDNTADNFLEDLIIHSFNVTSKSLIFSEDLKICENDKHLLICSGLLHDNGKFLISKSVLCKTDKLNSNEIEIIKKHPTLGADKIRSTSKKNNIFWHEVANIVEQHHEDYNPFGYPDDSDRFKGYPKKVFGKQVHFIAKIISISDWYVSCREDRIYRAGMDRIVALKETLKVSGSRLDPSFFYKFVNLKRFDNIEGIEDIKLDAFKKNQVINNDTKEI